jgi:predicted ArsR family transcriptional regulator
MSVERKEQGSTRQSILQLLRRHGELTAQELSDALGIGAVGIRQHLALLERDQMVHIVGLRRNIGRPANVYQLTPSAEAHFPKCYDGLALDVIDYLAKTGGLAAVDDVLAHRRAELTRRFAPALAGKSRAEQVATLARLLAEQGYMCEYEQLPDGSFTLTEYNCPVDCVARQYPQFCTHEITLYADLLGTPLTREGTIAEGQHCCRYHIPA